MGFLFYTPELRMGISEAPSFLPEEEAVSMQFSDTPLQINENQTYFIKFYGDHVPERFKKANFVVSEFPGSLFIINFRNYVGLTRIGPVRIRVRNNKISDTLYHSLLDYIAGKYADLIFSFGSPVGQSYKKSSLGRDIAYIEYLFLKRSLIDKSSEPDIDSIQHTDSGMLMDILTSPGEMVKIRSNHALLSSSLGSIIYQKTGRRLYPVKAREEWKYHSIDTNENRFMKFFLEDINKKLEELYSSLGEAEQGYLNPDISENLTKLKKKIECFLNATMWKDVGRLSHIPANSQVLQRRDGYRQLYRLYSLLQLVTHCDFDFIDFEKLLETKDTASLFEYWCFFLVKDILDHERKITSFQTLVSQDPLEQKLGQALCIGYEGEINLWFNLSYGGSCGYQPNEIVDKNNLDSDSYSHSFRPDIIISKGEQKLIFDAKYKGKRGGFYGESDDGTITSWKDEDMDKMHTYREAINKVFGAYILYPGTKDIIFPCHTAESLFEGVGALPLRPKLNGEPEQMHVEDIKRIISGFINHIH
jgi:Domain of unknown function (DUF2357)/PD-(D/E)XK nuclease superfamily